VGHSTLTIVATSVVRGDITPGTVPATGGVAGEDAGRAVAPGHALALVTAARAVAVHRAVALATAASLALPRTAARAVPSPGPVPAAEQNNPSYLNFIINNKKVFSLTWLAAECHKICVTSST